MRYLVQGLGGLLTLCLTLRLAAWLITPAIPMLTVLAILSLIVSLLISRHRSWK